jgi:formylglycine-generating enzyme required for sulfatase activity
MVRLPGGTFKMSSRGDLVKVSPFLLDVTEVTVAAYGACVQSGKCAATGLDRSEWGSTDSCTWGKADRANYPINCVDWSQAAAYCAAVGTRLPSEEEWEWAARGAELGTTYPWGNEPPRDQLCWNGGSVRRLSKGLGACAVGSFGRGNSPQGVMDLAGNVWEWTSSAHDAPTRVFRDGRWSDAVSSTRIFRGGRWSDADASNVAASHRGWFEPSFRTPLIGFRCARTP